MPPIPLSIKIANYKCFGSAPQGFDAIHAPSLSQAPSLAQYEFIETYLSAHSAALRTTYKKGKVALANEVAPLIQASDIPATLDLDERLREIMTKISSWNGRPA